ncbi:heptaprenyl diphosphate synthase [Dethiosulfatibacter aminovorans DSM 17477]|uniref:Heptaprenyl diphosphate synthase n=1 Tax=Dethiosulfatibacter aminovorans DSM 17477 TaxID=1121476 RepID=A0A1M6KIU1_9FIRM|nr:Gx transporter family protein [Dethiosulfatibacter aminovorans]SHJ58810.1 heptaprenyl diphosphate synthase [Dethiosulfatibacter aminovorans DSM 17477]
MNTREYIFLALLTTGALVLSILEGMIPLPFIAPGARLGLANMVILSVIVVFGFKKGLTVAILKSILVLLAVGNPIGFLYSISGAILSVVVMHLAYRYLSGCLSLIGVSVLGALAHNTAQVFVAAAVLENMKILTYLPVMYIVSLFTGCFVGYASIFIVGNLKKQISIGW